MPDFDLVHEHMEIVGSDGQHIGALLNMRENALVLAAGAPDGDNPLLPLELVDSIEAVIRLKQPARAVIASWLHSEPAAVDSAPTTS